MMAGRLSERSQCPTARQGNRILEAAGPGHL
jgi:hypothetical protein